MVDSALSRYVHLTAQGYKDYGIYPSDGKPKGNQEEIGETIFKNHIENKEKYEHIKNKGMREDLKKKIYYLFGGADDEKNPTLKENYQNYVKIIQDYIENQLRNRLEDRESININWQTGDIGLIREKQSKWTMKEAVEIKKNLKIDESKYTILTKSLTERLDNLEQIRNQLSPNDTITQDEVNKMQSRINNVLTKLRTIKNNSTEEIIKNYFGKGEEKKITVREEDREDFKTLVKEMNSILSEIRGNAAVAMSLKGDLFEYAIALSQLVTVVKTEGDLKKILNDFEKSSNQEIKNIANVLGGVRSSVAIGGKDKDIFKNINWESLNLKQNWVYDKDLKVIKSILPSQEKVDVEIFVENNPVKISAKNVNFKGKIHIVSGTSLLSILQLEEDDFMYHYLNTVAEHNDDNIDNSLNNERKLAGLAMSLNILEKALMGGNLAVNSKNELFTREKAELFIVKDNKKTGIDSIYVLNITDILNKIQDMMINEISNTGTQQKSKKYFNISYEGDLVDEESHSFQTLRLVNTKENNPDGARKRVEKMIMQLHQLKISASLNLNRNELRELESLN